MQRLKQGLRFRVAYKAISGDDGDDDDHNDEGGQNEDEDEEAKNCAAALSRECGHATLRITTEVKYPKPYSLKSQSFRAVGCRAHSDPDHLRRQTGP